MKLNLSLRRVGTILGGLALAAGAIVTAGPAALASPAKPNAAASLCKTDGSEIYNNDNVQLWYSATCRTAWGVVVDWPAGTAILVFNSAGATESNTVAVANQRTVTAAVNDAGITSYACANDTPVGGNPKPDVCTASY